MQVTDRPSTPTLTETGLVEWFPRHHLLGEDTGACALIFQPNALVVNSTSGDILRQAAAKSRRNF